MQQVIEYATSTAATIEQRRKYFENAERQAEKKATTKTDGERLRQIIRILKMLS